MIVIGLSGKARHGKDTVAQEIIRYFNELFAKQIELYPEMYQIKKYAFGDAVKEEVAGREWELCQKYGLKPDPDNKWRNLLQFYGTDIQRVEDEFYWIKKLIPKLYEERPRVAIISDVRFYNEAQFIKEFNKTKNNAGYVIRINRQGFLDIHSNNSHISEIELDQYSDWGKTEENKCKLFDYEILCGSDDLEELKRDSREVFDRIREDLDDCTFFEKLIEEAEKEGAKLEIKLGAPNGL